MNIVNPIISPYDEKANTAGLLKKVLNCNVLSFAVPWKMFQEMEWDVDVSFLDKVTRKALSGEKK